MLARGSHLVTQSSFLRFDPFHTPGGHRATRALCRHSPAPGNNPDSRIGIARDVDSPPWTPCGNPALSSISGDGCCADRPGKTLCSTGICVDLQVSLIAPPGTDHGPRQARSELRENNSRNGRKTMKKKQRRGRFQIEKSEENTRRKSTFSPANLGYFQIGADILRAPTMKRYTIHGEAPR